MMPRDKITVETKSIVRDMKLPSLSARLQLTANLTGPPPLTN
jgi:hypothetical protein